MKSLRFLFSSGRLFATATLLLAALLCCTMPAAFADATVVVLDSGLSGKTPPTPASTGSTPHTFMSTPFTLGSAAGTTNISVNGGTLYLVTAAAANYTNVQANVYFWGTVNTGTVSTTAPAYSNLLGSFTLDLGAFAPTGSGFYTIPFTIGTPISIPTRTVGVTVGWKSDTGSGLNPLDNNLTTLIRYGPAAMPVGAPIFLGYYRNANSEINGNFTSTPRTLGQPNESIAIDLTAVIPTPVISSFSPTSGPVGTSVVITGTGFSGATSVTFNGVPTTSFTVNSATQITATVPTGATSGTISVTTAGGTATSTNSFTVTAPSPSTPLQGAIISEFRLGGPGDSATAFDEFIEISNQGSTPLDLTGWSVTGGAVTVTISSGKVIPAYGRLLLTGNGYSLKDYGAVNAAQGDVAYNGDMALGSMLTLRNASGGTVDVVASGSLPSPIAATDNYSYVRRLDSGRPLDTGSDPNDFNLVDVQSTTGPNNTTGISNNLLRLGAPGPENLASPISNNSLITFVPATAVPASVRNGSGNSGTLALRYLVTNKAGSGRTINALRFRVVALTTGATVPANSTPADLRLISSTSSDGTILPLLLQQPPTQPNGGGLNSTVSLATLPGGGLAPGASVTVELLFNVAQKGTYRFLLNTESVTSATP